MVVQLFEKKVNEGGKAISSFQAMMVSTGSRVGTGNIAGERPRLVFWFRVACLAVVFVGCLSSFDLAWNTADILMGIMCIINLIAILLLGKWALKCLDDYSAQRKQGINPVFDAASIPGLPHCQCWNVTFDAEVEVEQAFNDQRFEKE